jgi:CRISPR-associated protein Csx14
MAELRIPIDTCNPGQFFACCGLVELLDAESRFDLRAGVPRAGEFVIGGVGPEGLGRLPKNLAKAQYELAADAEESVKPVVLSVGERTLTLDWWLDPFYEKAGHLKCWAGQVTTDKLMQELLGGLDAESGTDLFKRPRMMKSKFGIDPRSAWSALDVGFSPNEHGQDAATFPAVELLGAVGLQGFRPDVKRRETVSYFLWRTNLKRMVARRAARSPWDGLDVAEFEFAIAKRGQSYKYFTFGTRKERQRDGL